MGEKKVRATSRVQVTVEIDTGGSWGPDCTIDQIQKQAAEEARSALTRGLMLDLLKTGSDSKTSARIISEPRIIAILVEEV
jgi:hypothetical protein